MSNQAICPIQEKSVELEGSAIALELQANGAAAQGVDSGQAAQDLHASIQSANSKAPVAAEGVVASVISLADGAESVADHVLHGCRLHQMQERYERYRYHHSW